MEIAIRSRNVDVSQNLRRAVEEKVNRLSRYLDGMDRAEVLFSEERNPRIAEPEVVEVAGRPVELVLYRRPQRVGQLDVASPDRYLHQSPRVVVAVRG